MGAYNKGEEVRVAIDEEYRSKFGKEANYGNILDFVEYAAANFDLSGDDRTAGRAIYDASVLFETLQKESQGKLPLQVGGEYIIDKSDISNAPLRLSNSHGGINLIYLSNRDNGAWNDRIGELRENIFNLSQGIKN